MSKLKYKTNINCGGCISKVTPFMDKISNATWEVDTTDKDKILTVEGEHLNNDEILSLVKEAGFEIDLVKKKRFGLF